MATPGGYASVSSHEDSALFPASNPFAPSSTSASSPSSSSALNPDAEFGSLQQTATSVNIEESTGQPPASKHSVAIFFLFFFKLSSMLIFIFSNYVDNFILVFITSVLLFAFDFWTVKNVSGRLLVGLRWWNEVLEDGTNVWVFESKPNNKQVNQQDSFLFWSALYGTPVIWLLFGIAALLSNWSKLLIVIVAETLACANVVGYWKCQKDAGKKLKSFIAQQIVTNAMENA